IYVTGQSNSDLFIAKFNNMGQYIWHQTWNFDHSSKGSDLVIDSMDNIYVTGSKYIMSTGDRILLLKYDSSGNELWNRTWVHQYDSDSFGIALDSLEDVYIAGITYSSLTLNSNFTLIKYDKRGSYLWHKLWGGDNYDEPYAISLDSNNSIYLAGMTNSYGPYDSCILKYSSLTQVMLFLPEQDEFFGIDSPQFDISVLDIDLNTTWYSLDEGMHNYIFTGLSGNINQAEWDKFGEVKVNITFYANNSAGYIGYTNVSVNKDLTPPVSSISY
ncbi:unnamed protein product, partial [marine sediment metagenome]